MEIIKNSAYTYLYLTVLMLSFLMVLQVVFFNLNTKMTEGQFGLITALKIFFSIDAFIMFAAQIEYLIHLDRYIKMDFIEAMVKAATKVVCF